MRVPGSHRPRCGATLFESAMVLLVFFLLVLGMLDLGVMVFRYNLASQAARHGARQAIVHGSQAPTAMGSWGPSTIDTTANTTSVPLVNAVKGYMIGFDLTNTTVRGQWLDGGNDPNQRVRVTISTTYRPATLFIPSVSLTAASTLPIAH